MPKVSVVICTYNLARYICEAIESVLNQTYRDYELIVIDDGSVDNTKAILNKYVGKLRYIYRENGGLPSARNLGIRLSKGKYVAFLDADDIWLPDKLQKQVKAIEEDDDVGLFYTAKYMMDANGRLTGDVRPHYPAKNLYDLLNEHHLDLHLQKLLA